MNRKILTSWRSITPLLSNFPASHSPPRLKRTAIANWNARISSTHDGSDGSYLLIIREYISINPNKSATRRQCACACVERRKETREKKRRSSWRLREGRRDDRRRLSWMKPSQSVRIKASTLASTFHGFFNRPPRKWHFTVINHFDHVHITSSSKPSGKIFHRVSPRFQLSPPSSQMFGFKLFAILAPILHVIAKMLITKRKKKEIIGKLLKIIESMIRWVKFSKIEINDWRDWKWIFVRIWSRSRVFRLER